MTDDQGTPARSKSRRIVVVVAVGLAIAAGFLGWLTVGDSSGCAADTPAVFARLYRVSSRSMEPALMQGDWIWAERRYYCTQDPERGDLVVLALPSHPGTVFIKRVIGLPGDRVQLQQAQLHLNGEPVGREWLESAIHAGEGGGATQRTRFIETLPSGTRYAIEVADPDGPLENTGEITVPPGQYFVMGDDRDHSEDSRAADFGLVPRGAIADRPVRVMWSDDTSRIGLRLGAPR